MLKEKDVILTSYFKKYRHFLKHTAKKTLYCPICGKKLKWKRHFKVKGYDTITGKPLVDILYLDKNIFRSNVWHHALNIKFGVSTDECEIMCYRYSARKTLLLYYPDKRYKA